MEAIPASASVPESVSGCESEVESAPACGISPPDMWVVRAPACPISSPHMRRARLQRIRFICLVKTSCAWRVRVFRASSRTLHSIRTTCNAPGYTSHRTARPFGTADQNQYCMTISVCTLLGRNTHHRTGCRPCTWRHNLSAGTSSSRTFRYRCTLEAARSRTTVVQDTHRR